MAEPEQVIPQEPQPVELDMKQSLAIISSSLGSQFSPSQHHRANRRPEEEEPLPELHSQSKSLPRQDQGFARQGR